MDSKLSRSVSDHMLLSSPTAEIFHAQSRSASHSSDVDSRLDGIEAQMRTLSTPNDNSSSLVLVNQKHDALVATMNEVHIAHWQHIEASSHAVRSLHQMVIGIQSPDWFARNMARHTTVHQSSCTAFHKQFTSVQAQILQDIAALQNRVASGELSADAFKVASADKANMMINWLLRLQGHINPK